MAEPILGKDRGYKINTKKNELIKVLGVKFKTNIFGIENIFCHINKEVMKRKLNIRII